MSRKWLPNFAELIDRLSIHQLKEVLIPENKLKYAKEMKLIEHDLTSLIEQDSITLSGELIRAIVVLSQINTHIWYNESKVRNNEGQDIMLLKLTHGLNGIRSRTINFILRLINKSEMQDRKTDCLGSEFKDWDISLEK